MKYLIARTKGETTLNGNEYLLGADDKPMEFATAEEAQTFIDDNKITEGFVWEVEEEKTAVVDSVDIKSEVKK